MIALRPAFSKISHTWLNSTHVNGGNCGGAGSGFRVLECLPKQTEDLGVFGESDV